MAKVTVRERIAQVLGTKEMHIKDIAEAMIAAGTAPAAKVLQSYLSVVVSTHPSDFERVGRGIYRMNTTPPKELIEILNKDA